MEPEALRKLEWYELIERSHVVVAARSKGCSLSSARTRYKMAEITSITSSNIVLLYDGKYSYKLSIEDNHRVYRYGGGSEYLFYAGSEYDLYIETQRLVNVLTPKGKSKLDAYTDCPEAIADELCLDPSKVKYAHLSFLSLERLQSLVAHR